MIPVIVPPQWEQELRKKLREAIRDAARERGIPLVLVNEPEEFDDETEALVSSKPIQDAICDIVESLRSIERYEELRRQGRIDEGELSEETQARIERARGTDSEDRTPHEEVVRRAEERHSSDEDISDDVVESIRRAREQDDAGEVMELIGEYTDEGEASEWISAYDHGGDILTICQRDTGIDRSVKNGDLTVDFDKEDRPVGIELLNASEILEDVY